jgi:hypothetical protein
LIKASLSTDRCRSPISWKLHRFILAVTAFYSNAV